MLIGGVEVLEQLAEFLVEREVAVLKSSSTWVPSPILSLFIVRS